MKNIYVGNLPHSTTEAQSRDIFEAHGAVEKVTLVTDASEANGAIATLNGTDVGGPTLTINEAKPKPERPRGGGHRFGGAGGRGARRLFRSCTSAPRTALVVFSNAQKMCPVRLPNACRR